MKSAMGTSTQDAAGSSERLIHSISMIKDMLLSNMQLREEQLKLASEHELTIQQIYQLKIENEDLRDRLFLTAKDEDERDKCEIEYQAYLPLLDFEELLNNCERLKDIEACKSIILTYIFSMKKENRNLHRRLNDRMVNSHLDKSGLPSMSEYKRPEDLEENFTEFRSMINKVD